MTTQAWQDSNARFLSAALAWIRAALEWHGLPPAERDEPAEEHRAAGISREHVDQLKAEAELAAATMEPAPPLHQLAARFGLSRFERDVLLLCAAMELDTRIPALCAHAQHDPELRYPTFALALSLFDNPAWDVLSPERPLRYWRLIEISLGPGRALTGSPLRIDERIANYIKGLNYLDDRIMPLVSRVEPSADDVRLPSQRPAISAALQAIRSATAAPPLLLLSGIDGSSKLAVALAVAAELGAQLYRMNLASIPSSAGDLDTTARLWQRESVLSPMCLYLDATDVEGHPDSQVALTRFIERADGIVFLDIRGASPRLDRPVVTIEVIKPTPMEQEAVWAAYLGAAAGSAGALSAQFDFSLATIRNIASGGVVDADQLWEACLATSRASLQSLARRIEPRATWDAIVLPEQELGALHQIADQVRHRILVYDTWGFRMQMNRGLGISALFAGDSGTGKTMAAEVLANELRLNLHAVDLSQVVSKYIGETEKNLRQLFDAAEDGGTILFFDEAEALAGKRSEVKDAHDRYANIEIAYLLQRMEAFSGLAILATNMKNAIDPAFLRRLRFVLNFPQPGVAERREIWQRVFPGKTPVDGLDVDYLARLPLAGGNIQSIAINAAFLACSISGVVTMPIVLDAARAEYRKLNRPVNESDFHWQAPQGAAA